MSATIPILIAFDAPQIIRVQRGRGPTSPENLGRVNYTAITMMSDASHSLSGGGTDNLTIKATVGDTIEWRSSTLHRTEYTVMLYEMQVLSGHMHPPRHGILYHKEYLPDNATDPRSSLDPNRLKELVWTCQPSNADVGRVTYNWKFRIVNNKTGETEGWFYWDPYIVVERP